MTRIWSERYDADRHVNHMPEVDGRIDSFQTAVIVEVGRYRLEFLSLAQLLAAISYFEFQGRVSSRSAKKRDPGNVGWRLRRDRKPGGSTRMDPSGGDHWEFQPWQSRLPKGIVKRAIRPKVLKALRSAEGYWS